MLNYLLDGDFYYGLYHPYLHYFFSMLVSMSPCIIAQNNGGLKAPIQLLGRRISCLAKMLNLGCLD